MSTYINLYHNQHTRYVINLSCLGSVVRTWRKYPALPLYFRRLFSLKLMVTLCVQCTAHPCPLLVKAPQHGKVNCSHPHFPFSYGSHCDFDCHEGFWQSGTPTITCNNSGHWSQDPPTCQRECPAFGYLELISFVLLFWCSKSSNVSDYNFCPFHISAVQCKAIHALSLPLSMNCSHSLGNFSFGSQCLFTCREGFSLIGTDVLFCSSTGLWNDSIPKCTGK